MWNLIKSIVLTIIVTTPVIHSLVTISISDHSEKLEDLSFTLGEPMDKCDYPEEETFQFNNMSLEKLRDSFVVSDTVKAINLEGNQISEISPNAFKAVPNLLCLNIQRNFLPDVYDTIIDSLNLNSLNKLNMADTIANKFYVKMVNDTLPFPDDIVEVSVRAFLPNLTHLDISRNDLYNLPLYFRSAFPKLTHLYLSYNSIYSEFLLNIPPSTKYLYLEKNFGPVDILKLPNDIFGLFINDNILFKSTSVSNLYPNLKVLSARNCRNAIEVFQSFDKRALIDLDLSFNNLGSFEPELLINAKSLKRLSLNKNSISSVNQLISIESLTDLSVAYNKISFVLECNSTAKTNLKRLNLRGNTIKFITANGFSNLGKLEKLDLSENHLTSLYGSWMKNLHNLRYLDLRFNMFSNIDFMLISPNSNLHNLFVGNNNFTNIEVSSLMKLPETMDIHISSIGSSVSCIN
ncbi:hypothetical protein M0802_002917 [Mischocyttarus mexicanus]|nr:hypothetical protein M0802_002917 [Mischocyttarus mexicanus]